MSKSTRRDGRAWRRHDRARISRRRRPYVHLENVDTPAGRRALGMAIHTAVLCSCWMCGNPRRHWRKEITLAEKRAIQAHQDGLQEFLEAL